MPGKWSCAPSVLSQRRTRTLQRRHFTSAACRGEWVAEAGIEPVLVSAKKVARLSLTRLRALRPGCAEMEEGWQCRSPSLAGPSVFKTVPGAALVTLPCVGDLPQIRTAYLSLRRRALCSNELGDRQMLVRVPCSAHGHPASKAGTLLTSFTLMNPSPCAPAELRESTLRLYDAPGGLPPEAPQVRRVATAAGNDPASRHGQ